MKVKNGKSNSREREREWLYNCVQEGDGLKLLDWLGEEKAQLILSLIIGRVI